MSIDTAAHDPSGPAGHLPAHRAGRKDARRRLNRLELSHGGFADPAAA